MNDTQGKYWETESKEAVTGKNVFHYFPKAGKLQISLPYFTNLYGDKKPGKTVTISLPELTDEARSLLLEAIQKQEDK